ncbi:hypothetical protein SNEBB_005347 [Seison nebaliae]|nr:hypothetical protein SNEBB_005347 [Seison nebaliae]
MIDLNGTLNNSRAKRRYFSIPREKSDLLEMEDESRYYVKKVMEDIDELESLMENINFNQRYTPTAFIDDLFHLLFSCVMNWKKISLKVHNICWRLLLKGCAPIERNNSLMRTKENHEFDENVMYILMHVYLVGEVVLLIEEDNDRRKLQKKTLNDQEHVNFIILNDWSSQRFYVLKFFQVFLGMQLHLMMPRIEDIRLSVRCCSEVMYIMITNNRTPLNRDGKELISNLFLKLVQDYKHLNKFIERTIMICATNDTQSTYSLISALYIDIIQKLTNEELFEDLFLHLLNGEDNEENFGKFMQNCLIVINKRFPERTLKYQSILNDFLKFDNTKIRQSYLTIMADLFIYLKESYGKLLKNNRVKSVKENDQFNDFNQLEEICDKYCEEAKISWNKICQFEDDNDIDPLSHEEVEELEDDEVTSSEKNNCSDNNLPTSLKKKYLRMWNEKFFYVIVICSFDVNKFIRLRAMHWWKNLFLDNRLSDDETTIAMHIAMVRICDQSAIVRKVASSLLTSFVSKDSFTQCYTLDECEKYGNDAQKRLDEIIKKKSKKALEKFLNENDGESDDEEEKGNEEEEELDENEKLEVNQAMKLFRHMKKMQLFLKRIQFIIPIMSRMLHSPTITDVVESIEFISQLKQIGLRITELDRCCGFIWRLINSNEPTIRTAVQNAVYDIYIKSSIDINSLAMKYASNLLDYDNTIDNEKRIIEIVRQKILMSLRRIHGEINKENCKNLEKMIYGKELLICCMDHFNNDTNIKSMLLLNDLCGTLEELKNDEYIPFTTVLQTIFEDKNLLENLLKLIYEIILTPSDLFLAISFNSILKFLIVVVPITTTPMVNMLKYLKRICFQFNSNNLTLKKLALFMQLLNEMIGTVKNRSDILLSSDEIHELFIIIIYSFGVRSCLYLKEFIDEFFYYMCGMENGAIHQLTSLWQILQRDIPDRYFMIKKEENFEERKQSRSEMIVKLFGENFLKLFQESSWKDMRNFISPNPTIKEMQILSHSFIFFASISKHLNKLCEIEVNKQLRKTGNKKERKSKRSSNRKTNNSISTKSSMMDDDGMEIQGDDEAAAIQHHLEEVIFSHSSLLLCLKECAIIIISKNSSINDDKNINDNNLSVIEDEDVEHDETIKENISDISTISNQIKEEDNNIHMDLLLSLQLNALNYLGSIALASMTLCQEIIRIIVSTFWNSSSDCVRVACLTYYVDLLIRFSGVVEPWIIHLYKGIVDKNETIAIRTYAVISQLIIKDLIKPGGYIACFLLCLIDERKIIVELAEDFLLALAKKDNGNHLFSYLPNIMSSLLSMMAGEKDITDNLFDNISNETIDENNERTKIEIISNKTELSLDEYLKIMTNVYSHIQKEQHHESMIERLCEGIFRVRHVHLLLPLFSTIALTLSRTNNEKIINKFMTGRFESYKKGLIHPEIRQLFYDKIIPILQKACKKTNQNDDRCDKFVIQIEAYVSTLNQNNERENDVEIAEENVDDIMEENDDSSDVSL